MPTPSPADTVRSTGDIPPAGLLDAFWTYDRALLTNDIATLDAFFAQGAGTIRGDGTTIVTGHDEIATLRRARTAVPTRRIVSVAVQRLSDETALVVAGVRSATTARGMQTQLWRRDGTDWKITAAHVTAPASAIDTSVWRIVGAPLKAPLGDGILAGETVAVKDLFAIEGQIVGAGVRQWAAERAIEVSTAPVVARLLEAGASVTGLAQTDQLAYSVAGANSDYGTPLNVQAPNRIPGGSSSGPASAVAQGLVTIGLGTDTAGSVRVPASYQGLWAIRTSHGRIPLTGVIGLAPTFDTVGWMTRDAETLARVAGILVPDTDHAGTPELIWCPEFADLASDALRPSFIDACQRLGALDVHLDDDLDLWFQAFRTVQAHEAWLQHGDWISRYPDALGGDVSARFKAASQVSIHDADLARSTVAAASDSLQSLLRGRVLLLPAAGGTPPVLNAASAIVEDDRARTLRLSCLASIAGLPAVVAPVLSADAFAAGLCFVGQRGFDQGLIETARSSADLLGPSAKYPSEGQP